MNLCSLISFFYTLFLLESISRLARSTKDLLNIVEQLKNKRVEMVSLKKNIDTHTPQGKFMLTIFGVLAELERENILQRQKEGIQVAKANGKRFGRPLIGIPKDFETVYNEWKKGKLTAVEAFKELKLKKTTFYKLVKSYEKQRIHNPGVLGD